jgi:hypothetical protein
LSKIAHRRSPIHVPLLAMLATTPTIRNPTSNKRLGQSIMTDLSMFESQIPRQAKAVLQAHSGRHGGELRVGERDPYAVGRTLGLTSDAARTRVARGLERRSLLKRRGITSVPEANVRVR